MKKTSQPGAKRNESVARGVLLLADLMRGKQHDRHSASQLLAVASAAASRYLKSLQNVPGVEAVEAARGLTLRFNPNQVMEAPQFPIVVAACLSMSLANLFEGTTYQESIRKACEFLLSRSTKQHRFGKSGDLPRKFIFIKGGGEQALPDKAEMLDDIIESILTQHFLSIRSLDFDGEEHNTLLRPLSIAVYKHQLYILGYDEAGNLKNFRFSRIQECALSERTFPYPTKAEYDPPRLFDPCFGIFVGLSKPIESVKIKLSARWKGYVRTHRWHVSQEVKINDDHVLVKLRVQICPELIAWILGFGAEAEVLEPSTLRDEVRKKVSEMARLLGV